MESKENQIHLIQSLFKGRTDVFAIRWEKGNKSGYMPSYFYDPYRYRLHKQKGGTFKNFTEKSYQKLDGKQISKHLQGIQHIGIYPLLKDNTSHFIVADFDKEGWQEQSKRAIKVCLENNIPAYLERSRSGNGGHVWIFFEQAYPASKSRKIILHLFERAGIFSTFDKNVSFDRLFPNQDYLSGKGLGNLIALPLNGRSLELNNSCFVDPQTLEPFPNQWSFLEGVTKVQNKHLDHIFSSLFKENNIGIPIKNTAHEISGELQVELSNSITINRNTLNSEITQYLKEQLNFFNTDYAIKKNSGKSTWKTERYFKLIKETDNSIEIPRGFIGTLLRFSKAKDISHKFIDNRKLLPKINFSSSIHLLEHQKASLEKTSKKDFGIIVAPPASGKTIIGLKIIEQKQQPTLIIAHRKQIFDQWISRIETFFGISKREIGKIGQGKSKIGDKITVALIQSLAKKVETDPESYINSFGTIIIDECHHIPAKSFREVVHQIAPYYQYGLTATPFRKSSDEKLIFIYLGDVISEIKPNDISNYKKAQIVIRETNLSTPFNSKTDRFETLAKILIHDSERNALILNDVNHELQKGKKAVIITERKDHIDTLNLFLGKHFETITISGDDTRSSRKAKFDQIEKGSFQVIITTGQFFGEGTDIQSISTLFLVFPFSFKGKLIQYIGRVQRSEIAPRIYDYRDKHIKYLNNLFLKRNSYYRTLERQATLFDDLENTNSPVIKHEKIERVIKVPISNLDFHYGMVCFSYLISKDKTLQFEIENEEMQPEFDVLKPYFSKILDSKSISVNIKVEFEEGRVVSKLAESSDVNYINKNVIESVKFEFISKQVSKLNSEQVIEKDELENQIDRLGISAESMLEELLKKGKYTHQKQLLYLSKYHEYQTLKIRFITQPFSFVFLLIGQSKYHIILETLNTKEATYIWHILKNAEESFKHEISKINQDLNWIRNNGRQLYIETKKPENFSRIIHDYKDEVKGFYKWKNALEERLV